MEKLIVSIFVFILGITFIAQVEKCNYPIPEDKLVPVETIKKSVALFESKKKFKQVMYDYRSAEPTEEELISFLSSHPDVTTIIRLNADGNIDSDGLRLSREKQICESMGVNYVFAPMTNNYKQWAESIMPIMLKEKVLVHCHHGYDRTGFIFAYKLMKYHGYTFEQVRKMNGWDKYDKYSKKFYPVLKKL